MRGRVGTDIGSKLLPVNVGVSLHSKTHPLFMKYSNGTVTQCYAYHYPSLFPVLLLQSLFNSMNFSFTCLHFFSLVRNKLHVYYSLSANQELNFLMYGENTICRPMYTVY